MTLAAVQSSLANPAKKRVVICCLELACTHCQYQGVAGSNREYENGALLQGASGWHGADQGEPHDLQHQISAEQQGWQNPSDQETAVEGGGMLHMYHQMWYKNVANCKLPSIAAPVLDEYNDDELAPEDEGGYSAATVA